MRTWIDIALTSVFSTPTTALHDYIHHVVDICYV